MNPFDVLIVLALGIAIAAPLALGILHLAGKPASERWSVVVADLHSVLLFVASISIAVTFVATGAVPHEVHLPPPLQVDGYAWHPVFLIDRVSVTYFSLVSLVYPAIVRFSMPAFHREPGAPRYWFLVTLLAFALFAVSMSGNIEVLYVGWELVGLCSVHLISFFRQNPRAAENSLRALVYYRLCDASLLGAAVWIHHSFPTTEFMHFHDDAAVHGAQFVGFLILFASLAKSAQFPMSPWLHRAMEGPAASSAIFYGALSVHLGPLLLLRTSPLWMQFPSVRLACIGVGVVTGIYATLVGRTRPDAKTSLAYATMAQLGAIYVEVGLGWHTLALVHLFAHAGLRTWQFLRSSSLIQDFQQNPLVFTDARLHMNRGFWGRITPPRLQRGMYLAAMRLFWIDALQWRFVARPWLAAWELLSSLEDRCLARERRRSN